MMDSEESALRFASTCRRVRPTDGGNHCNASIFTCSSHRPSKVFTHPARNEASESFGFPVSEMHMLEGFARDCWYALKHSNFCCLAQSVCALVTTYRKLSYWMYPASSSRK